MLFRLGEMKVGETITIGVSGARPVTFRVDQVLHTAEGQFPTEAGYGPNPDAQLRLLTCSGIHDRSHGGCLDNTVVFATAR